MKISKYSDTASCSILIMSHDINMSQIAGTYLAPFGIDFSHAHVIQLHKSLTKKKTPKAEIMQFLKEEFLPAYKDNPPPYILVNDGEYFKALTTTAKADLNIGYVLPCSFLQSSVVFVPSHKSVFYDPEHIRAKIKQSMNALITHAEGTYEEPGTSIIKHAEYPVTYIEIEAALERLLAMNCPLAIDIEGFSLKHYSCGIGSISFAWNDSEGISFLVDYEPIQGATAAPYGRNVLNQPIRKLLLNFFLRFKQRAIYHNISFDATVLIYQLLMDDLLDTNGILNGLDVMLSNWDDTKLITYLATNSCAGNELGLKAQAQEFAGNYAESDIVDITLIPPAKLLKYNLVDTLSTWFVYNKHWPTLIADNQLGIYNTIFKPAILDIVQMQLTGLPIDMVRVREVKDILTQEINISTGIIIKSKHVEEFIYNANINWVVEKNNTLKVKRVTIADAKETFNPNSGPQLQKLLFDQLQLPVLELTKSKLPATDKDTLKALINHTTDQSVKDLLKALVEYSTVNKLLTSFIPAFESSVLGPDGWYYLFGNFNLGGTLSGRLSSSDPNLQNLPASKKYGKLIKSCIKAPPGWLWVGLDFASLEDRISAVTTKDPNKKKVYTEGWDGHCLRAYSYFKEKMPDIDPTNVISINSIADKYPDLRGDSKAPTFALTYLGTHYTLMKNCGFSKELAIAVETSFHELYVHSTKWVEAKLKQAAIDGYVTAAFGLRVRTPLLKQVIRSTSKTPYEAEAEGRSAANSLGQSWCLLNTRAGSEFMGVVRKSEERLNIRPSAQIHDAQYFMIRDNMDTVIFTNGHLVKAIRWQEHPDIADDDVKLEGELSIFHPTWEKEIHIPNDALTPELIEQALDKHFAKSKD